MPTFGTPVHIAIEGFEQLRALQVNIDLLSSLVEEMTPLAGISLPELTAAERTRCRILVDAANEALRGMKVSTEIWQAAVDTMSAGRAGEVRWLERRLEEWHCRTIVVLVKLEMAIALSAAMPRD